MLSHCEKRLEDFSLQPSDPLFYKLQIHKIQDIFILRTSKFVFNCLIKVTPVNFHSWFKLTAQIHNHNTRSKFADLDKFIITRTLFVPAARTTNYGLKLIKVQGAKLWNNLPAIFRVDNTTFSIFIKKLKTYLLDSYQH